MGNARKQIKKFPGSDQRRILESLENLSVTPFVLDIIKLKGVENNWRLETKSWKLSDIIRAFSERESRFCL